MSAVFTILLHPLGLRCCFVHGIPALAAVQQVEHLGCNRGLAAVQAGAGGEEAEIWRLFGCLTMDVVGSTAFGYAVTELLS